MFNSKVIAKTPNKSAWFVQGTAVTELFKVQNIFVENTKIFDIL